MDLLAVARRRAFSFWLRTGRLPRWAQPAPPEVKYNPWHDPDDGRFTFAGTGRYFGRGSTGGDRTRTPSARMAEKPKEPFGGYGGGGRGFNGGGASGSWDAPEARPQRNHDAKRTASNTAAPSAATPETDAAIRARNNKRNWRHIERNGYEWKIDPIGSPRQIAGTIKFSVAPRRSRTAQRRAGGPDRRPSDDGGHYIAARFGGPAEDFNHFAQDANFNRGLWRTLENQWASETRARRRVDVKIVPLYEGLSRRPYLINVWFWIDGEKMSQKFPNEPREKSGAKR